MRIHFYKYQCAGNDFVLIHRQSTDFTLTEAQIKWICERRNGIGSDGLVLIDRHPEVHFSASYFNSDGSNTLCSNSYRAAVLFASRVGLFQGDTASFKGHDGIYSAQILADGRVRLRMPPLVKINKIGSDFLVETGVHHYVSLVSNIREYPVVAKGRTIRFSEQFRPHGLNVNFVQLLPDNQIFIRTFERGVEDETLSCATGSVAAAAVAYCNGYSFPLHVKTLGGDVLVEIQLPADKSRSDLDLVSADIYHTGPAKLVFEGDLDL